MENCQTEKNPPLHKITWINRVNGLCFYGYLVVMYHFKKIVLKASPVWWLSATVWSVVSYIIISDYMRHGDAANVNHIWFLCSILWAQFGLASAFSSLMKNETDRIPGCLFRAVFPPLLLHLILFSIVLS